MNNYLILCKIDKKGLLNIFRLKIKIYTIKTQMVSTHSIFFLKIHNSGSKIYFSNQNYRIKSEYHSGIYLLSLPPSNGLLGSFFYLLLIFYIFQAFKTQLNNSISLIPKKFLQRKIQIRQIIVEMIL